MGYCWISGFSMFTHVWFGNYLVFFHSVYQLKFYSYTQYLHLGLSWKTSFVLSLRCLQKGYESLCYHLFNMFQNKLIQSMATDRVAFLPTFKYNSFISVLLLIEHSSKFLYTVLLRNQDYSNSIQFILVQKRTLSRLQMLFGWNIRYVDVSGCLFSRFTICFFFL